MELSTIAPETRRALAEEAAHCALQAANGDNKAAARSREIIAVLREDRRIVVGM